MDCCGADPCTKAIPGVPMWNIAGVDYDVCPVKAIDPEWYEIVGLYGHYQNGMLPRGGGLLDQTEWYGRVMRYVAGTIAEMKKT